jgi:hypothetical protein
MQKICVRHRSGNLAVRLGRLLYLASKLYLLVAKELTTEDRAKMNYFLYAHQHTNSHFNIGY